METKVLLFGIAILSFLLLDISMNSIFTKSKSMESLYGSQGLQENNKDSAEQSFNKQRILLSSACDQRQKEMYYLDTILQSVSIADHLTWIFVVNEAGRTGQQVAAAILSAIAKLEGTLALPKDPLIRSIGKLPYHTGFDEKRQLRNKVPNTGSWRHRTVQQPNMNCFSYNYYLNLLQEDLKVRFDQLKRISFLETSNLPVNLTKTHLTANSFKGRLLPNKKQQKLLETREKTANSGMNTMYVLETLLDVFPQGKFIILNDLFHRTSKTPRDTRNLLNLKHTLNKRDSIHFPVIDTPMPFGEEDIRKYKKKDEIVLRALRFLGFHYCNLDELQNSCRFRAPKTEATSPEVAPLVI